MPPRFNSPTVTSCRSLGLTFPIRCIGAPWLKRKEEKSGSVGQLLKRIENKALLRKILSLASNNIAYFNHIYTKKSSTGLWFLSCPCQNITVPCEFEGFGKGIWQKRDSGTFCSQSLECPDVIQTEVGPPPKLEGVGQPSRKEFHKHEVMQIESNEKVHTLRRG